MIRLAGVSKSYGPGKLAVDNLSLHVRRGEVFGFLGHNGAGKTTTLRMIVGLLIPDAGSLHVASVDVVANALAAKRLIGFVPDNPDLYPQLTGLEFLSFIADVHGVPSRERAERIQRLAGAFELASELGARVSSYSHGMQQKLALIAALVHQPPVWILDEPMVGLDPHSAHTLELLMREHCAAGNTVFFSTHVLDVAERLCDRIAIIKQGRILACGTMDELRSGRAEGESLVKIFLDLTAA